MAEMLKVLLLAVNILQWGADTPGLQINWQKTKLQPSTDISASRVLAQNIVEIVHFLTSIGSKIHNCSSSETELCHQAVHESVKQTRIAFRHYPC